jgi:hypothetical protein
MDGGKGTEKAPGDKRREQGKNRENLSFPSPKKGDENTEKGDLQPIRPLLVKNR